MTAGGRGPTLLMLLATAGFVSLASTRVCDGMLPALAQDFATTTTEAAAAISAYAVAYGLMQLVYGPIGDRYGKARVIMLATAWCALSTLAAAAARSLDALVWARAAMGAGTAAIVPLSVAWIGDTVPLAQRQQVLARYSGVTVFGLMLGPLVGGFLSDAWNWRAAFVLLAALFAAVTAALWLSTRRATDARRGEDAAPARLPYLRQLRTLLADRWARRVMAASCVEAGLGIGCLAFVPTVLHTRFGLSLLESGAVAAAFGLGGFAFTRTAAPLLRRLRPTAMPLVAGGALAAAFGMLALMPRWEWGAAGCVLGGFGFYMMHNVLNCRPRSSRRAPRVWRFHCFPAPSSSARARASCSAHRSWHGLARRSCSPRLRQDFSRWGSGSRAPCDCKRGSVAAR
ncbi:MFS transporter [Variovorax defluvii]|uniref:MFS transporter n=1 Tax=Variovorax defluvii TaxID=913761 RepID=A0ABP8I8L8_9BURK